MPKYRIEGEVIEAASPDEAYALADEKKRVAGMSPLRRLATGAGRGVVSTGTRVGNFVGAGNLPGSVGASFSDEETQRQDRRNRLLAETKSGAFGLGTGEAGAGMVAGGGAGALRQLGARGSRLLASKAGQVIEGAVTGAAISRPGERKQGAAVGAGFGAAIPAGAEALRRIAEPVKGVTQSAKDLIKRGVDLTAGEMNPGSWLNQFEQAATSAPYFGGKLATRRNVPLKQFRTQVAEEASVPGTKITPSDDVNELYEQAAKSYDQPYEAAVGGYTALEPRIVGPFPPRLPGSKSIPLHSGSWGAGAVEDATQRGYPGTFITDADRAAAATNARNQLSGVGATQTSGRELQTARSNLRKSARDAETAGQRRLTKGAADEITASLESQLAPDDAAALRALDARYPGLVVLRDATRKAGDNPDGWTPFQLSQAVRSATDEGEYALGKGPLRDLSKAGREVFANRSPETGARNVTIGKFPGTKAAGVLALNQIPSEVLAGLTPAQQKTARALIGLVGFERANPIIASMAKNAPVAYERAGE